MSEISTAVIQAPFSGVRDFHLILVDRGPQTESFLFIPESEAPGLTIDLIRVDVVPLQLPRLQDFFEFLLAQQAAYAGPGRGRCVIASASPEEIVFHYSFAGHPVAGAYDSVARIINGGRFATVIQVLRKIEALAPNEVAERITFVKDSGIDLSALRREPEDRGDFAKSCLAETARLSALFQRITEERNEPEDLSVLKQVLCRASPLHAMLEWALLAKLVAVDILELGQVEEFGTARRMLGLAALAVNDVLVVDRDAPPLKRALRNTLTALAELLLYATDGDRVAQASRAAGIWRLCAEQEADTGQAAGSEVMAAFAQAFAGMELSVPLDAGLGPATASALRDKEQVDRLVDLLDGTANRMAHVARRHGRDQTLHLGSCLAADLAQFLVERATALGSLDFDTYLRQSVLVAKWQLDAQVALFGLSQADLDMVEAQRRRRASGPARKPSHFVYLRPLATARRELMPNRFPAGSHATEVRYRLLPKRISLEAALHVALSPDFDTEALGGPLDIFGMRRGTVLGGGDNSWRGVAGIMIEYADLICVLPGETEGLSWELAEILRQGAAGRTIFVVTSRETKGAPEMSPMLGERLGAIGYALPERIEPGFLLLNADGSCERQLPFDWLWDGRLRAALRDRLRPVHG